MKRKRTQEDVDRELVSALSGHEAECPAAMSLFDIRIGEMKRSGVVPDEQRVIVRVWRHGPIWVAPMSVGPALVPFTDISTKDLGRTEMREMLGGPPDEIVPGPGGAILMRRGPLTGAIVQVPDDTESDELVRLVTDLRERYDPQVNAA